MTFNVFIIFILYILLIFIFFINSYKTINKNNVKFFAKDNFISLIFYCIYIIFSINFCGINKNFNEFLMFMFKFLALIQFFRIIYLKNKFYNFLLLVFSFFINKPYVFLDFAEISKGCSYVGNKEMLGYANFISIPIISIIIILELLFFIYDIIVRNKREN